MDEKSFITSIKKKTLFLVQTDPDSDVMFREWLEKGYLAAIIFKKQTKFIRLIRRIWIYWSFPALGIWLADWKKELAKYDTIVLHISRLTLNLPRWIHRKYPKMRIICWYWNTVDDKTRPEKITDKNVEYWSFDLHDCSKYQMKHNIQYYTSESIVLDERELYDIYFVGRDKERKEQVENIGKIAEDQGLSCNFHVIDDVQDIIPYKTVKKEILESKAILEINKKGQNGYTLRTLESLFLDKKLITNNRSILDAPFYRKNNIFVIGYDNLGDLQSFMKLPYDYTVGKYKRLYDLDTWFENFFK